MAHFQSHWKTVIELTNDHVVGWCEMRHGWCAIEYLEVGQRVRAKSSMKIPVHFSGSSKILVYVFGSIRILVHFFGSMEIPVHFFGSFRIPVHFYVSTRTKYSCPPTTPTFLCIYSTKIFLHIPDISISTYLLDQNILLHPWHVNFYVSSWPKYSCTSTTFPFLRIYSTVNILAHLRNLLYY